MVPADEVPRARNRGLGKLDPCPDVHVYDNGDDLEHLLRGNALGQRVVEALKRPPSPIAPTAT
jgi:hypothetical protein